MSAVFADTVCLSNVNMGLCCERGTGRNAPTGTGFANIDFGVVRKFKVTERVGLSLQGNLFNLFNHANFGLPSRNMNSPSLFGKSTSTYDPRIVQLALRLDF